MDLVKTHLTNAVNEELVNLKAQIERLNEKCSMLEKENLALKQRSTLADAAPKAQSSTTVPNTVQVTASQTQQVLQANSISNLPTFAPAFAISTASVQNEIPTLNDESVSMMSLVSTEPQEVSNLANLNTLKETMYHSEEATAVQQNDEPQQI